MDRAYSVLQVRGMDDDERVITGVATTPKLDRQGDIVVSTGARFRNPVPLLLAHKHDAPVGTVELDRPSAAGIRFRAQLPKVTEPGTLRDRVEEAWQSIKHGLITAVSIGFRAMPDGVEFMRGGGMRFTDWELLELSLVAIPANSDAAIELVKAIDREQRKAVRVVKLDREALRPRRVTATPPTLTVRFT